MTRPLELLLGPRSAVGALADALRARGLPVAPSPLDLVERRLGAARACPAPGAPPHPEHVCPEHDPLGYHRRVVAEARALEADQPPGALVPHGVPGALGRFAFRLEGHLRPLVDPEAAAAPRPYARAYLLSASARTPASARRTNLLRAALERTGTPIVPLPPASVARRAAYVAWLRQPDAPPRPGDPSFAPALPLVRAEPRAMLTEARGHLAARGVGPDVPLLLRTTEGLNLHLVRLTGTDRGDRRRTAIDWSDYQGPARVFHEVVFASTEDECLGRLPSPDGTCLDKLDETPSPLLLAYDGRQLDEVRRKEYAFRGAPIDALLAVFQVQTKT